MESFDIKVKNLCLKLFDIGVLKFGNFKMKVGMDSPVYFDLRIIVSFPSALDELCDIIREFIKLRKVETKIVCGVPYTALPLATIISVKSGVPMVIRRKEKKSWGTMKLIEGKYNEGDECVIIEDVVTSGSSILETVHDLTTDGLKVKDAIVVLDRQQGGSYNLKRHDINMHSLLDFNKVLEILLSNDKITTDTAEKVREYIAHHQITPNGEPIAKEERVKIPLEIRAEKASCTMARVLMQTMIKKKSLLCVALDAPTSAEVLALAGAVAESAVVLKTHADAVSDWSAETEQRLMDIAKGSDCLIMEDRKLADIGNTVRLQCEKVFPWAELVTMHSLGGEGSLKGAAEAASKTRPVGIFLVAQLSSKANLITPQYTKGTLEIIKSQEGLIAGLVCQSPDIVNDPGLIQLTPGVTVNSEANGDSLGQQYCTMEEAVLNKGGDLIVIGRSITQSSNPAATARTAREQLWQLYQTRIKS